MPDDSGEKTEQATQKRMKEVLDKGQLSRSQDMTAWLGVGAAALMLPSTISLGAAAGTEQVFAVGALAANPDPATAVRVLGDALGSVLTTLTPFLSVVALSVLVGSAAQGGFHLTKLQGKFEQFNLVTGLNRVFGTQALWNGFKALLKTAVVGLVLFWVIQGLTPILMTAGGLPVSALLDAAGDGAGSMLRSAVLAGLALAVLDVFVVMRRNRKKTRMTKKEVKDENKNTDGDPLIKSQRRSRQLAMSRNRMMAAIADSDVVVINPTHIAIALKYEPGKSAPRVVAKGAGTIAARIREQAATDGVPMVRDIPLARALHAACELGQEIPVELYNQVARVLAFVMALKRRGSAAGVHTMTNSTVGGS
ncbi:flagellar biosynthesis protein FlhB [Parafrigoribacterium mesophilum]|uniref:EscU/YscU/HrcU family type III secretion system export apparatus switch protein n=1 Tax=Parafrigoribacterium mesophilum TaxID=433646 RepID=UPI0031FCF0FD